MSHFTFSMRRRLTLLCMLALLCTLTALPAAAAEREIVYNERYCFSFEDFATSDAAAAPRDRAAETPGAYHRYGGAKQIAPDSFFSSETNTFAVFHATLPRTPRAPRQSSIGKRYPIDFWHMGSTRTRRRTAFRRKKGIRAALRPKYRKSLAPVGPLRTPRGDRFVVVP